MENNLAFMSFSFAKTHADETDQVKVVFVKESILSNWPKKRGPNESAGGARDYAKRNFSNDGGHGGPNLVKLSNWKYNILRKSALKFKDLTFLYLILLNVDNHLAI